MDPFGSPTGGQLVKCDPGYAPSRTIGTANYPATTAPPPTTNAGAIPCLLNDQVECLKVLHQTIGELETRLAAVLGPTEGYPQPGPTENPSQAIPARIEFTSDAIRAASARVRMLLSGLQL